VVLLSSGNNFVEERLAKNEAKTAGRFRNDQETGVDVEYRKVRLERVLLVSVYSSAKTSERDAKYSLDELERLSVTAGAQVVGRILQQRPLPDPATYVGKGKAQEVAAIVEDQEIDTLVVNETLQPSTRRSLEDIVDAKVIDRTALILDIFAQHAKTKAGRAQVELAQLEYLLPRLRGWGQMMSRQAGGQVSGGAGMGSRGPGETQLEIDRRRITHKISELKQKIKKIKQERLQGRKQRVNSTLPSVAIVGYTNTGKSSLLNKLTGAHIIIQDALFATLDTTTRRINNPKFSITDTVGFIQDLPTTLVEAFKSTLEEAIDCDVLVHIVDASAPSPLLQIETVRDILSEIRTLDAEGKVRLKENENEILCFNKIDLLNEVDLERLKRKYPNTAFISVRNGDGIKDLNHIIAQRVKASQKYKTVDLVVPFEDGSTLAKIYRIGEVISRQDSAEGVEVTARVPVSFQFTAPVDLQVYEP
jgi:GTP-binding protein HflX